MKEEKYEKAMAIRKRKLIAYSNELHALVGRMLADKCSTDEVIGMLETEKMYRFQREWEEATSMQPLAELLEMLGGDCE